MFLLHHAIDQAANQCPDHDAVRCLNQQVTYAELVQRTNSLARALIDRGVRKNDRVGIFLNKSLESLIAIFGIMKAGAAYVPLDPAMPIERLRYVIEDCTLRIVITRENKLAVLSSLVAAETTLKYVIGLPQQPDVPLEMIPWAEVYSYPGEEAPDRGIIEQDLAYIMYTSGSTGAPKGIMHTHHSGLSYGRWAAQAYDLSPTDRIANHTPLHFDISTFDFWGGTLAGATIVLIPESHTRLPASFSKLLADEQITLLFTVPFALIQLALHGVMSARDLNALRWVIYGGEPFPPKHLRALMALLPQARFSNIYGPAEVNGVTFYHVPPLAEVMITRYRSGRSAHLLKRWSSMNRISPAPSEILENF